MKNLDRTLGKFLEALTTIAISQGTIPEKTQWFTCSDVLQSLTARNPSLSNEVQKRPIRTRAPNPRYQLQQNWIEDII